MPLIQRLIRLCAVSLLPPYFLISVRSLGLPTVWFDSRHTSVTRHQLTLLAQPVPEPPDCQYNCSPCCLEQHLSISEFWFLDFFVNTNPNLTTLFHVNADTKSSPLMYCANVSDEYLLRSGECLNKINTIRYDTVDLRALKSWRMASLIWRTAQKRKIMKT